jgi:hypothetical protein
VLRHALQMFLQQVLNFAAGKIVDLDLHEKAAQLSENLSNHVPMHIGESAIDAVVAEAELFVIDA